MRIVAGNTAPLPQRSMHPGQIEAHIFDGVAFMADLVALLLEEKLPHHTMPKVTAFTFSVCHDVVYVIHRKILVDEFVMTIQAFLLLELPFLRIGGARKAPQEGQAATKHGYPPEHCGPFGESRQSCNSFTKILVS
jgi:hypothetical protein